MIINLTHLHRLEEFTDGQTKLLQDWQTQTDKYKIQNHETNQYKAQSWIRAVGGKNSQQELQQIVKQIYCTPSLGFEVNDG